MFLAHRETDYPDAPNGSQRTGPGGPREPRMKISVILPAYNEQDNLAPTVERSVEALRERFEDFELIVLDDASTDRTLQVARELAAKHPQVRVLPNERNLGQGLSQLRGFREARFELVIHNGVDYPFDFRDLDKMLPLLDEADIVVAARTSRPGYTVYRRFLSWVNRMLLRALFPLRLSDYNFVQLYRCETLQVVGDVMATSAGFVVPEILFRARDLGYRIRQTPIEYHRRQRGVATVGNPRVVWRSFCDLFAFWWARARGRTARRPRDSASRR